MLLITGFIQYITRIQSSFPSDTHISLQKNKGCATLVNLRATHLLYNKNVNHNEVTFSLIFQALFIDQ